MTRNTEADLHTLLDSLTDGEHVKATWKAGQVEVTAEGPVYKDDLHCACFHTIRWDDGKIESTLTSVEVIRDGEVTVTRDDEEALRELIDSLEDGEAVTAEWRDKHGSMSVTGTVLTAGPRREVRGCGYSVLRHYDGFLHSALHSVTVRRTVVQRWGREGDA